MTAISTTHHSRRSQSTALKMRLHHFRSRLTTVHDRKQSLKLISRSKYKMSDASAWMNRWSLLHLIVLCICVLIYHPPIKKIDPNDCIEALFLRNNRTLTTYKYLNWIHHDWCSSSSNFLNNTNSHAVMIQSIILLSVTCCMILILAFFIYFTFNEKSTRQSANKGLLFWRDMVTLGLFIGSSIFNQWFTSVTCRPVQLMYDQTYTLMILMQIFGFIACLDFSYCLGNIYKPVFRHIRMSKFSNVSILSKSGSLASLLPPIKNIP